MYRRGLLLVVAAGISSLAQAQDQSVAARVGFLGLGVEYTYALNERVSLRGGINGAQYGFDAEESGIAYDFDLIWDSLSVGVDFHPSRGPFRLSAGLLSNDNGLDAQSRLAGSIDVGGTVYTPAEVGTLRASVGFDSTAPFVGLGWDWSRKEGRRFGVSFDLGIVRQGAPRLTLSADGSLANDVNFAIDLATEKAELEDALDGFDLFPYATLGFVFKF